MGYTPNEIAIFYRDNDQQNHWVFRGLAYFQTNPYRTTTFSHAPCVPWPIQPYLFSDDIQRETQVVT